MTDDSDSKTCIASDRTGPHLKCYLKTIKETNDAIGEESSSVVTCLIPEEGKRSSFLLQRQQRTEGSGDREESECYSIATPAELVIENGMNAKSICPFFFGGLQLIFSAKHIEIYLTPTGGKETYLMTCRGIPYKAKETEDSEKKTYASASAKATNLNRAICVVPGGPRNISRVRIKLIGSTCATNMLISQIHYMKFTARIVDPSPPVTENTSSNLPISRIPSQSANDRPPNSNPPIFALMTNDTNTKPNVEAPLTASDFGAAMAGLSFMARKTEQNMVDAFKQQSKKMEELVQSSFKRMDSEIHAMNSTLAVQTQMVKESQNIVREQQRVIAHQNKQIEKLLIENDKLKMTLSPLEDTNIHRLYDRVDEVESTRDTTDGIHSDSTFHNSIDPARKTETGISSSTDPSFDEIETSEITRDLQDNVDSQGYDHAANVEVVLVEDESPTADDNGEKNDHDSHVR